MTRLTGRRVVLVIAQQGYRSEELNIPKRLLEQAGARVVVASSSLRPATAMNGELCYPDLLYCALNPAEYDALVFVGGVGSSEYFPDRSAHRLAQAMVREGKLLGAICFASSILANAGVLQGRSATGYPSRAPHLKEMGVRYSGDPVTVHGSIVTGRGPEDSQAFGQALVEALAAR